VCHLIRYPYTSGGGATGTCRFHSGQACPTSGQSNTVYHAASAYTVSQNVAAIQTEIMTNGPVEAAFEVYQDFFSYSGGVYKHVSGGLDGGHAVKIIGWGVDQNQAYWLVANSWGNTWGLQGFFMILRGVNECGIEAGIVAGLG
jgi:cathepsin B